MKKNLLSVAVKGALGLTAAAIMVPAMPAFAQQDASMVEEVVVTGSRIQRDANEVSVSPVTTVNADDFKATGVVRVEDLINSLPQVAATQTAGQANGATGTATVSLRGLESQRTLVLIDGRRMPAGSPVAGGSGADLNQIPGALVERVEVLTGGSSATYGSDAIAGVVNFIMKDDFEGLRFETQTSLYQHNNNNSDMQNLVESKGFDVADGSVTDGEINDFALIMGANLDNGRGNVTAYANYRKIDSVLQSDRDYSGCALAGSPDSFGCGGSTTMFPARFTDFGSNNGLGPNGEAIKGFDYLVEGNEFVKRNGEVYNYGPLNYFQRPDERWTMGAFAHYDINDNATAYTQLMYADDRTVAQIAPSGAFFVTSDLNCGNPLLSEQQFEAICGVYGLTKDQNLSDLVVTKTDPDGNVLINEVTGNPITAPGAIYIGRRNVEGGPRQDDLRHTSLRGVFGVRGDINESWSYDVYAQYAEVSMEQTYLNDFSATRIARALNVVEDDKGNIVCQSVVDGSDPTCVPYNIFQEGGVTQEALNYLILPLFARGTTEQEIYSGYVTGNLGDYGVQLPSADSGVAVVMGLESRRETLNYSPDNGFLTGDGAGQGGPTLGVDGSLSVKEVFTEMNIPLVTGKPGFEYLGLEMAYRYSDYSTDISTDTFKLAADWSPISDLKVRASFQSAMRHANIRELYRPRSIQLFDMTEDPCGSRVNSKGELVGPSASLEACMNSGITAATYGGDMDSPAGQYNFIGGGTETLTPEESETVTFGFVYSPSMVEGLTVSVDYFNIDVTDAIDAVSPETVLNKCLETGEARFCDSINRGANGNLWVGEASISSPDANLGFIETAGIDVNANYGFDIGRFGSMNMNFIATYLTKWDQQEFAGEAVEDCNGVWNGSCGEPTPEYVSTLRATWATPVEGLDVTGGWRHISAVDDLGANGADFDAIDYFDLSAAWAATDNVIVRSGINNLLDEEPPLTADAGAGIFGNGNTFPGIYDALGRYAFLGVTVDF
ncbi:TonB-dependent receptor plug domain-containing protein [Microbulbifer sp. SH-1]|uniref:TonB-dependent receptor domain-containing protein n=1 Tax=Microbulbifer sp. SH-1 TaxID=2681547 RepID=UPI00140B03B3|nr:TonB-dependent receptor [Microbulbifer sp. SH-1]QIL89950.1 TonB-dependent receptor plug domain-containing protein [Microbulbifer sp. SH-1]